MNRSAIDIAKIAGLGVFLLFGSTLLPCQAEVLQGEIQEQGGQPSTSGLTRSDITPHSDPFAQPNTGSQTVLEPPSGAFEIGSALPPKPPPNFNLNAEESGANFNGAALNPMTAAAQSPLAGPLNPNAGAPQSGQEDPENSPEMQLAWDAWHKRVAGAIYQRFTAMSHTVFKYCRPLAAYVSYTVTRDGRITNAQLQQKSPNVAFNTMVLIVVNSLSGQRDLLAFPPGSRRMYVEKGGMFTENYGPQQGFKFTTGDRETIRR